MDRDELEALLRQLQSADLIRPVQGEEEAEFWFKHAATQEAVYGTLLKSTRADLHRRVAEAIERTLPEGTPDRSAMLALHFERAGVPERAFKYAAQAGDEARRTYALREAIDFYDRALAMAKRLGAEGAGSALHLVYASRGQALQALGDNRGALENFRAMLEAARAGGDPALEADALNRLVTLLILIEGLTAEVVADLDEALRLAEEANDLPLVARTLWNSGLAYRFDDPARGKNYLRRAEALLRGLPEPGEGLRELLGHVLSDYAITHWVTGNIRQSAKLLTEAETIFRALDHRPMLADTLGGLSTHYWISGEFDRAEALAREGLKLSESMGNRWAAAYNYFSLLPLVMDSGRFDEALYTSERALADARVAGFPAFIGGISMTTAELHYRMGQFERSAVAAAEARDAMEAMQAPIWSAMGRGAAALGALLRGDAKTAWAAVAPLSEQSAERERDLEGVLYVASLIAMTSLAANEIEEGLRFCAWFVPLLVEEEAPRWEGEMRYWCGRLRLAAGDPATAEPELLRARELLAAAKALALLWPVDAALADLYAQSGNLERAEEARRRARETVNALADGIADQNLRAGFLGQPDVARVISP